MNVEATIDESCDITFDEDEFGETVLVIEGEQFEARFSMPPGALEKLAHAMAEQGLVMPRPALRVPPSVVAPCCFMHATPEQQRAMMIVCRECGNKRCPRATSCSYECTRSNEPGQPGSIYTLADSIARDVIAGTGRPDTPPIGIVRSGDKDDSR